MSKIFDILKTEFFDQRFETVLFHLNEPIDNASSQSISDLLDCDLIFNRILLNRATIIIHAPGYVIPRFLAAFIARWCVIFPEPDELSNVIYSTDMALLLAVNNTHGEHNLDKEKIKALKILRDKLNAIPNKDSKHGRPAVARKLSRIINIVDAGKHRVLEICLRDINLSLYPKLHHIKWYNLNLTTLTGFNTRYGYRNKFELIKEIKSNERL
jgi:hypothetical protein